MSSHYDLGTYRPVSPIKDDDIHLATKGRRNSTTSFDHDSLDDRDANPLQPRKRGNVRLTRLDRFNDWTNDIWFWEILAVFLSFACLGVVIWRLYTIDQESYAPYENTRPSPNTFVSIFVTAAKALALFAVADGIGQLRWLYYRTKPKSLDALDAFEGASRGVGGSLLFLLFVLSDKSKARLVASWGALIMVVALAMDPFAQEILTYPSRHVPLPQTVDSAWMSVFESHGDSVSVQGDAGRQAVFGGMLGFEMPVSNGCATGNCTWPPFTSLGVCSSCTTVPSSVLPTCVQSSGIVNYNCTQLQYQFLDDVSLILQNGSSSASLMGYNKYTLLKSSVSAATPRGIKDPTQFSFALASLNISLQDGANNSANLANPIWSMTNCSLGWCAKVYENLTMINNVLVNTIPRDVQVQPVANSTCWSNPDESCEEFEPISSKGIPHLQNKTFKILIGETNAQIRGLMNFDYNVTVATGTSSVITGQDWTYSFATLLFLNKNITSIFDNVVNSYTNFLRSVDEPSNITGTATVYETYVNVTWRWFILPAVVVLVSAAFLLTVIVYTRWEFGGNNVIWKTTTLPLLLHGLEGWKNEEYTTIESSAAMTATARGMRAELKKDDAGQIRFVKG